MSDRTGDMEVLFPQALEVKVKGETISVSPLFFGQYPKAIKLFLPVFEAAKAANVFFVRQDKDQKNVSFGISADWPLKIPTLIAEGGEPLMEFVAFATGRPRKWLDTVPGDEGFALTKAVFDANIDFFNRRILPMMQKAGVAANPLSDGATSSPVSSEQDTDGTTSSATP